jgi:serine/threonine protein kinase
VQGVLPPGAEISRYRVENLVARGGMGLVYRARDRRLDRPVALKVLSPEYTDHPQFRERFVRESRLAAAVDHPHVIPIYEADEWNGMLYIAMRFVEGADLHGVLAGGPLDIATTLRILGQAAAALDVAHRAGLVHRDVKPGNLMMSGAGPGFVSEDVHVYLTDFGLTRKVASISGLTTQGQFLGTLNYVAPEQIRGEDVDRRADVYALACVAFEMLSGQPPFVREDDAAVLWAQMYAAPPALADIRADVPDAMEAVLQRAMAKHRDERPVTCGEFVAALRATTALPPGGPRPVAQPIPRSAPGDSGAPASLPPVEPSPERAPTTVHWRTGEQEREGSRPRSRPPGSAGGNVAGGSGARASGAGAGGGRRRGHRLWTAVAVVGVLVVATAALFVWRPWDQSQTLETRDLSVAAYQADVPADWDVFSGALGYAVVAPADHSRLFVTDDRARRTAADAVADEPDSVVGLYVAPADRLGASNDAALQQLLAAALPAGTSVTVGDPTRVAGRDARAFTGSMPLDDGVGLRLSGVVVLEEPQVLLLFFAPTSVVDGWDGTFRDILGSVRASA